MLRIRLRRMGSKHKPYYRIVVSDSRRTPSGSFVDAIGTYDPRRDPARVNLDVEKALDWMRKGAHPSETVRSLIEKARAAQPGPTVGTLAQGAPVRTAPEQPDPPVEAAT